MSGRVNTYCISIDGDTERFIARTPAAARYRAFMAYSGCRDINFKEFLRRSTIWRVPNERGTGDRIWVNGEEVTRVATPSLGDQGYCYMRDGDKHIMHAHYSEVSLTSPMTLRRRA